MLRVGYPIEQKMPFAIQKGLDGLHEDVKGPRPELASNEPPKAVDAASQTPNPDSKCNAPSRHRVFENVSSLESAECGSAKWTRFVPAAIPLDHTVRVELEVLKCTIFQGSAGDTYGDTPYWTFLLLYATQGNGMCVDK